MNDGSTGDAFSLIAIDSNRGPIACAYHPAPNAKAAVIMVGGGDGGLDGPAEKLYPDLAADLQAHGIAALRLDFRIHRFPGPVEDGVHDVVRGIRHLLEGGCSRIGLLGHSFGGAVVIEAGVRHAAVASVATLASQTAGAQRVGELSPRPLLLVHGLADTRLDPDCSRMLFRMAGEPKRLVLYPDATHSLRQRRDELRGLLLEWFVETLA
jgi:alpha/beta superfamily hydrolase